MPPKKRKEKYEQQEVLRAVVLADSFNSRFHPLTADRPRVLLPLANIPIINYTLDFLLSSAVEEIYIICHAFGEQIQDHVDAEYGALMDAGKCKIKVIVASDATSIGDCLRSVEELNVIEDGSTFVLVHGDIVSNVPLTPIIDAHKERYKKNKSNIMTMMFKAVDPGHKMRTSEANIAIALGEDQRLLSYVDQNDPQVRFPMDIFQDHDSVQIRADVIDSHIYVCTKELLNFFKDEFDVQDMFGGIKFIHGDEIYCHRIFAAIINKEYAARATDIHCYDAISKDILHRWTYPLVPDVFCQMGQSPACRKRYNIYLGEDVLLTRGCVIEENTLVGENTTIGREGAMTTVIQNSIIGKDCSIGAGVHLDGVYLFDGVVIEDGCVLDQSIIGCGVKVCEGAIVGKRCVLGHNTVVGADAVLPTDTVVADVDDSEDEFNDSDSETNSEKEQESDEILGDGGRGKVVVADEDEDEDDYNTAIRYGWVCNNLDTSKLQADEEYETESDNSDSEPEIENRDPFEGFLEAMVDLITERVILSNAATAPLDELRLETRSNRAAYNMSMLEVVLGLAESIVTSMDELGEMKKGAYAATLKKNFVKLAPLFETYVRDASFRAVDFVTAIEEACFVNENAMAAFQTVVHGLYEEENELVTEQSMIQWYNADTADMEEGQIAKHDKLKEQSKPFIDWLQTADSETESDED